MNRCGKAKPRSATGTTPCEKPCEKQSDGGQGHNHSRPKKKSALSDEMADSCLALQIINTLLDELNIFSLE